VAPYIDCSAERKLGDLLQSAASCFAMGLQGRLDSGSLVEVVAQVAREPA
jgi:hypothetical protein